MKVFIEHLNYIRTNHGIPTQSIEDSNKEFYIPEKVLQDLLCVMSDEIVDLRDRLEVLENE